MKKILILTLLTVLSAALTLLGAHHKNSPQHKFLETVKYITVKNDYTNNLVFKLNAVCSPDLFINYKATKNHKIVSGQSFTYEINMKYWKNPTKTTFFDINAYRYSIMDRNYQCFFQLFKHNVTSELHSKASYVWTFADHNFTIDFKNI